MLPVSAIFAASCFCLVDEDDNLRHSCVEQQQGIRKVVQCRDDAGGPYPVENLAGWRRIEAGRGRCNPCRKRLANPDGAVRGREAEEGGARKSGAGR